MHINPSFKLKDVKLHLGAELMFGTRVERWGDENGMARPLLVNLVESSVILSDHEDFVLMLLSRNANQPVV